MLFRSRSSCWVSAAVLRPWRRRKIVWSESPPNSEVCPLPSAVWECFCYCYLCERLLPAELLAQMRRERESASQHAAALKEQLDTAVLAKEAADTHGQTLVQRLCAASNSLLGKC